jgi:NDP-hexose 4-ketoreductase
MARLVVLGAGGFMGRAVSRGLLAAGHDLVCVDLLPRAPVAGEQWLTLDVFDPSPADLAQIFRDFAAAAIINCAGLLEGSPEELARANVLLVARLLQAAGEAGTRLVHLGSAAEYGAGEQETSLDEESPTRPTTPYGATKLAGSLLAVNAGRAEEVDAVVLRLFNPLGPGMPQGSMPGRAAALIVAARDAGKDEIRMGSLDAWRDFVDVRDLAAAVALAAFAGPLAERLFNVGSARATQAREVVLAIAEAAGWEGRIVEEDTLGSPRSTGISWQRASIDRITRVLGWKPQHSLREAAASVLAAA